MVQLRKVPTCDAARVLYAAIFDPAHAATSQREARWRPSPQSGTLLLPPLVRVPGKHTALLHLLQKLVGDTLSYSV